MEAYLEELRALRQRIAIGGRHGLVLLHQTNGDVAAAEALFQQELTRLVAHQAQVPEAAARQALELAGYEVPQTLQQLEQARYSLTQRLLRRYREPADAVRRVANAVEQTHQVPRTYWLRIEAAQLLPPPLACVLVVSEWLAYEDWEGLDAAVYFHLEAVLDYVRPAVGAAAGQPRPAPRRRAQTSAGRGPSPPVGPYWCLQAYPGS